MQIHTYTVSDKGHHNKMSKSGCFIQQRCVFHSSRDQDARWKYVLVTGEDSPYRSQLLHGSSHGQDQWRCGNHRKREFFWCLFFLKFQYTQLDVLFIFKKCTAFNMNIETYFSISLGYHVFKTLLYLTLTAHLSSLPLFDYYYNQRDVLHTCKCVNTTC